MACDLSCGFVRDGRICDRVNPRTLGVAANGRIVMGDSCLTGMDDEQRRLWLMKTAKLMADAGIGPAWGGFPADLEIDTMPRAANTDRPDPPPSFESVIEWLKNPMQPASTDARNLPVDPPPSFEDAIREQNAINATMAQSD